MVSCGGDGGDHPGGEEKEALNFKEDKEESRRSESAGPIPGRGGEEEAIKHDLLEVSGGPLSKEAEDGSPARDWKESSSTKAESQEQEKRDWAGDRLGTPGRARPGPTVTTRSDSGTEQEVPRFGLAVESGTKHKND